MDTRRRALVAALVGVLGASVGVAGAGHFYLRKWRRGAAWFVSVVAIGFALLVVFADPAALTLASLGDLPPEVSGPLFGLLFLSTFDAYSVAAGGPGTGDDDTVKCPHCRGELDPEVAFCPWCAAEFETPPVGDAADARPAESE